MKYIKTIDPINKKEIWLDGEEISFQIPDNIVDFSSFKIYYDVYIDPVESYAVGYLKRFMPRLSQSIIQEFSISQNGNIIQTIKDFNLLYNIINDATKEKDDICGNKPDTLLYSFVDENNIAKTRTDFVDNNDANVLTPLKYTYFIDNFLGLLSERNQQLINTKGKNIKIHIKLAPREATYRGIKLLSGGNAVEVFSTDYHYRLSNVFANIDVYTDNTPTKNEITFQDYITIKGEKQANKNVFLQYKHKGNLKYIMGTFTDPNRDTDTGLQLQNCNTDTGQFGSIMNNIYPTLDNPSAGVPAYRNTSGDLLSTTKYTNILNNSVYFKRTGCNIKSSQYVLNGQNLTPIMNMNQIYNVAKDFFANKMDRVKSIASFEREFFVFPIMIGQTDEDFINEIEWVVNADNYPTNAGGTPFLFLCYDKTITI